MYPDRNCWTEDEAPIYCGVCQQKIPAHELACRFCFATQQPVAKTRYRPPSPDSGELLRDVPPLELS